MYSTFSNQAVQLLHYGFSLLLIFGLAPPVLFAANGGDLFENMYANSIRIVYWIIVAGYILVALKIFEAPVLLVLFVLSALRKSLLNRNPERRGAARFAAFSAIYNMIDGVWSVRALLKQKLGKLFGGKKRNLHLLLQWPALMETAAVSAILAMSAYLRFYDSIAHAAPSMSDAYVVLEGMKSINDRVLFANGLAPQGYYIVLGTISRFAAVNPLYVLKYTGPLVGLATVAGLYLFVSRITGNKAAGITAALLFGVYGSSFDLEGWNGQISAGPVEFALMFLMPAFYYFYRWIRLGRESDYRMAVAASSIIGFVNFPAYAFLAFGIVALAAVDLIVSRRDAIKRVRSYAGALFWSALPAGIPIVLGMGFGKKVHILTDDFHMRSGSGMFEFPAFSIIDSTTVAAVGIVLLSGFFGPREKRISQWLVFLLGMAVFALHYADGIFFEGEEIDKFSHRLELLSEPLLIGVALGAMAMAFRAGLPKIRMLQAVSSAAMIAVTLTAWPPVPKCPYKLESDEAVEQILRISSQFRPWTWLVVYSAEEAGALTDGSGYHLYTGPKIGMSNVQDYFLGKYDPGKPVLTKYGEDEPDRIGPNIFIFYEKEIYKQTVTNGINEKKKAEYESRERDMPVLKQWLDDYRNAHGTIDVYYEDEQLTVYYLKREQSRRELNQRIWG